MSIGDAAIGECAVAAQGATSGTIAKRIPKSRQTVAKADVVAQPEAR